MIIQRILRLLDEKSLKMADLCRHLGINTSTMTNWKKRNTDPPAKYIIPICEFLNVDCEFLLSGQQKKNSEIFSKEDSEWLSLLHQLPLEKRLEFKGELKGYIRRLDEETQDNKQLPKASGK